MSKIRVIFDVHFKTEIVLSGSVDEIYPAPITTLAEAAAFEKGQVDSGNLSIQYLAEEADTMDVKVVVEEIQDE